jgi:hypothetical protein
VLYDVGVVPIVDRNSRAVGIELLQPLTEEEQRRLREFAGLLEREGGSVVETDASLRVNLVSLDMSAATRLLAPDNGQASGPLAELLEEIKGIGAYGIRGGKRVFVGYNAERKVAGRKDKELTRKKHFYAQDAEFGEVTNDLPEQFRDVILTGDAESILKDIPDGSVDLVFTSPPYNFGLDYEGNEGDAAHWNAYFQKLFAILDQCIRVLKFGGRLAINVQPLFSDTSLRITSLVPR